MDYTQEFLQRAIATEIAFNKLDYVRAFNMRNYSKSADAHFIFLVTPKKIVDGTNMCFIFFGYYAKQADDMITRLDNENCVTSEIPLKMCFSISGTEKDITRELREIYAKFKCEKYVSNLNWKPDITNLGYTMCIEDNVCVKGFCKNCDNKGYYCDKSFYNKYSQFEMPTETTTYELRLVSPKTLKEICESIESNRHVKINIDSYDKSFLIMLSQYMEMFMCLSAKRFLQGMFAYYCRNFIRRFLKDGNPQMYVLYAPGCMSYKREVLLGADPSERPAGAYEHLIESQYAQIREAGQNIIY